MYNRDKKGVWKGKQRGRNNLKRN